jgi:hypothetical protein
MRARFEAVLLAGISCAGLAQSPLPVLQAGIPSEPQLRVNADGHGRGLSPHSLQPDQLTPLAQILRTHSLQWDQAQPATEFSNESPASSVTLALFDGRTASVLSADAMDLTLGLPNPFHTNHAGKSEAFANNSESEFTSKTKYKASVYVPLDSWIYPAFDRLAAMGYIPTSSATARPWTRLECARLLAEAREYSDLDDDISSPLLAALDLELAHETGVINGSRNRSALVESVYGRSTSIAGTPLRDSFHFGQTLVDDFGRPYGQGENGITGASLRAEAGPMAFYLHGEYQYAAAMPAYSQAAQQAIASFNPNNDALPFGWNLRDGTTSRIRLIEAYATVNLSNWQLSFGQQGLWWGPDRSTSLILSNNAEAMPMLRLASVSPLKMPGFLNLAGPVRFELFLARQGGVHYVGLGQSFTLYGNAANPLNPPPFLWGATLSFKPTPNLELGFGQTVIFAGYGRPLNLKTFLHTFSVLGNGQAVDPGKRAEDFNFSYHLPRLRRSVVAYSELFAWDDPIEGKFVARFAMDPGIYMPRLPGLQKMDLRMEGVYTNLPKLVGPYFYSNAHYPQGYTNYGQIIGSWIGRQGIGGQASSSYWLTARTKATASYRRMTVDQSLLQGGDLSDFSASMTWAARQGVEFSAIGQLERWKFPLLATGVQSNLTASFEIRVHPKARVASK